MASARLPGSESRCQGIWHCRKWPRRVSRPRMRMKITIVHHQSFHPHPTSDPIRPHRSQDIAPNDPHPASRAFKRRLRAVLRSSMRGRRRGRHNTRGGHTGNNKRPRDPDQPLYFTDQWLAHACADPWATVRNTWDEFVAQQERTMNMNQWRPPVTQWRPPPPGWKPPPPPPDGTGRTDGANASAAGTSLPDRDEELGKMNDEAINDRPWH